MGCERTQDLLSAYLDGELVLSADSAVTSHLATCHRCRQACRQYDRLRALLLDSNPPTSVNTIWKRITNQLSLSSTQGDGPRSRWCQPGLALAVALVLAATIAIPMATLIWFSPSSDGQLADLFDNYLEQFKESPEAAQSFIDMAFPTTVVQPGSAEPSFAASILGTKENLPGMTLVEFHLHRLPCCTCIQGLYRRSDGTMVSVFEHTEPTAWDAHQNPKRVRCGTSECRVTQASGQVVASWEHHSHTFTVIGVEDERELAVLVSKL